MDNTRRAKRKRRCKKETSNKTTYRKKKAKVSIDTEFNENNQNESFIDTPVDNIPQNEENLDIYFDYYGYCEETYNYGDGVEPETLQFLKHKIFDLIKATQKSDIICYDAEKYLAAILGVCSIEQRKEVMQVKKNVYEPLTLACKMTNLNMVKFFVEHCQAEVNGENHNGRPLLCAVANGDEDIVHYLLECNADFNISFAENYNMLMLSLQLFPQEIFKSFGYKSNENFENQDEIDHLKETLALKMPHKFEIVKLLIDKGAIEKCTKEQIFYILTSVFNRSLGVSKESLQILVDKIPNFYNVRNADGMSVLGYEILHRSFHMSEFFDPYFENAKDINEANFLKFHVVPFWEKSNSIENNVDFVLESFTISKESNNICLSDMSDNTCTRYVHPLVYLACTGNITYYMKCLQMPGVPFDAKVNGLEMIGTYCLTHRYYLHAVLCWNAANKLRQHRCLRKTRNKTYFSSNNILKWEEDISLEEVARTVPLQAYVVDMTHVISKIFTDTSQKTIEEVTQSYITHVRTGVMPDLTINTEVCSFMSHVEKYIKDNTTPIEAYTLILIKNALVHERMIGYGDFNTLGAFESLANEFYAKGKILECAALVTYSYPYFVKHLPNEVNLSVIASWDKKNALKNFISPLIDTVLIESLHSKLSFDLSMAIWKCFFLECCVTPRCQRKFLEFASLLVMMKRMARREKTAEEYQRFSEFMKKVIKTDLRNLYGQSLLHYTVPSLSNNKIDMLMSPNNKSPMIYEFSGSVEMIKLLLTYGADPNALDDVGMTPLHFCYFLMLDNNEESGIGKPVEIVQTLLEGGAHPDCADFSKCSAIESSQQSLVPLCPVSHQTLQCLASNAILNNGLSFHPDLPPHLVKFVELHKKHGRPTTCCSQNFPEQVFG